MEGVMKRISLFTTGLLGGMLLIVTPALAGPVAIVHDSITINVGDKVEYDYTVKIGEFAGGGIFRYKVYDSNGVYKGQISTFCVELADKVVLGQQPIFNVGPEAITGGWDTAGNVVTSDPLRPQSAWLYTKFLEYLAGNLQAFGMTTVPDFFGNVGATDNDRFLSQRYWANALQVAIWYFEGEAYYDNGVLKTRTGAVASNKPFITYAEAFIAAANDANPQDIGFVTVVNPQKVDGMPLQGFLNLQVAVPEPAGLTLLGMGLLAVGFLRRRF